MNSLATLGPPTSILNELIFERGIHNYLYSKILEQKVKSLKILDQSGFDDYHFYYDGMKFPGRRLDLLRLSVLLDLGYFEEWTKFVISELQDYLKRKLLYPDILVSLEFREVLYFLVFYKIRSQSSLFGKLLNPRELNRVITRTQLRIFYYKHNKEPYTGWVRHLKDNSTLPKPGSKEIRELLQSTSIQEEIKLEGRRAAFETQVKLWKQFGINWCLQKHIKF